MKKKFSTTQMKGGDRKMKYLKIRIDGQEDIKAYLNEDKKSDKHPDFSAPGVAVWMNEGRDDKKEERLKGASRPLDSWPDDDHQDSAPALREPAFAY